VRHVDVEAAAARQAVVEHAAGEAAMKRAGSTSPQSRVTSEAAIDGRAPERALDRGRDRAGIEHVLPMLGPWLIPETTRSAKPSSSPYHAVTTQSVGVPSTL